MSIQLSVTARNQMLEALELTYNGQTLVAGTGVTGTAAQPKLQIRTGAAPADCATAASGTLLAEITLPSDWWAAASAGSKALSGTWSVTAVAAGTAAHYRIVNNAGTVCHEQGVVGMGSGDISLDNTSIAVGQTVTITSKTMTVPHA